MTKKRSIYSYGAIAVLAVAVVAEGLRLVLGKPWPGFVPWNSHLASATVVTVGVAAVLMMFRGTRTGIAARTLAVAAALTMAGHGLVLTTAKDRIGALYFVAVALFIFLAQRAFRAENRVMPHPPTREVLEGRMSVVR
ncbi:MAG: hypothetical protein H5U40_16780 [Polyangiaceae bacterium]|nr:hypothetical protein [Polyangiaceae bacterium]